MTVIEIMDESRNIREDVLGPYLAATDFYSDCSCMICTSAVHGGRPRATLARLATDPLRAASKLKRQQASPPTARSKQCVTY